MKAPPSSLVSASARAAKRAGYDLDRDAFLGCGVQGCVFGLRGTSYWVGKSTGNREENRIARRVMRLRARDVVLDGVVAIESVTPFKLRGYTNWLIVRERVVPFEEKDVKDVRFEAALIALYEVQRAAVTWLMAREGVDWALEVGEKKAARNYCAWAARIAYVWPLISETLITLARHGIFLQDVHAGNIGYAREAPGRHADAVIFDLGQLYEPQRRKRNPSDSFPYRG